MIPRHAPPLLDLTKNDDDPGNRDEVCPASLREELANPCDVIIEALAD
jgi:hypothetical protein